VQLRHRRLQQDETSSRLSRVEPNDRLALSGEREAFRLAIQIAEPPRIKERYSAATRGKIIEPRNRGGLVTRPRFSLIATV
jgi:hypothetical protein